MPSNSVQTQLNMIKTKFWKKDYPIFRTWQQNLFQALGHYRVERILKAESTHTKEQAKTLNIKKKILVFWIISYLHDDKVEQHLKMKWEESKEEIVSHSSKNYNYNPI